MMKRVLFGLFAAVVVLFASCEDAVSGIPGANETGTDEPGTDQPQTETAATPVALPGAGAVPAGTPVTLSTATEGAVIYYTVDGADPASAGTAYTAPIVIDAAKTVRAVAKKSGMADSGLLTAAYTIDNTMAAAPGASVDTGTYNTAQSVTLTPGTTGGSIYYTTDGSVPTATNGTLYGGPVAIDASATLKAVTVKEGMTNSPVMVKVYTLKAAKPAASVPGGSYSAAQNVTLSTATGGANIYYTTNGSAPSETSTPYTGAVAVGSGTTTLKAVAVKSGWTASDVLVETYTVTLPPLPPEPEPPAQSEPEENFTAVANSTGVTITGYSGLAKEMVIPATIKGQPVTKIGDNVFKEKYLTHLYIPSSVASVGDYAFADNQLASVHIPNAVTSIGDYAFAWNQLTSITIGNKVFTIGNDAFPGTGFAAAYGFYGGAGTYTRNNGGNWAKGTQEKAGDYWYTESGGNAAVTGYAGSAKDVEIPGTIGGKTVTKIGVYAFSGESLTSVTIPDSVATIGVYAFYNNQLTSVTIPDGVTTIGDSAFSGNSSGYNQITRITIGNKVAAIGSGVFRGNFADVFAEGGAGTYVYRKKYGSYDSSYHWVIATPDGNYEYVPGNGKVTITGYTGTATVVEIPGTLGGLPVTAIGNAGQFGSSGGSFANKQLTSVTIPDSVITIGAWAFYESKLTSVIIGNGVTAIGNCAFEYNLLTSVTIPDSVTQIGDRAFFNNELTSVDIPDSVTSIGSTVFAGNQLTSVTVPDSVKTIGYYAFGSNQLTSVTIPDSVTSIGDSAFYDNQLTSVTIPSSVTTIGKEAFYNMSDNKLTSVTIGSGVTLGIGAFPGNLGTVYTTTNYKMAGTYTSSDKGSTWTKQ
jgi:hypothetical protein